MGIRNHRPDLNGLLVIDKPLGWSSGKVCAHLRRVTRGGKVGHAGTLDPLATGVLVCCLGRATKAISLLMDATKVYRATIDLSATSNTDDLEGEVTPVAVASPPDRAAVEAALGAFRGEILQVPPVFSAIQVDGKRAYKLARQGQAPELKARPVRIDALEVEAYEWPRLVLCVTCGKGTYIRSLARDLGASLGVGGMLTGLVRTRVGDYEVGRAVAPDAITEPVTPADLLPIPEAAPVSPGAE